MGFRTVVMLNNDQTSEWEKDPELGRKIMIGMNYTRPIEGRPDFADLGYGRVVECTHADTETLAVLDGYTTFRSLSHEHWQRGRSHEEVQLALLKAAAAKLCYQLTRKAVKK